MICKKLLCAVLASSLPAVAGASQSWLIYPEGELPNRELVIVDQSSLKMLTVISTPSWMLSATPKERAAYQKQEARRQRGKPLKGTQVGPDDVFELDAVRVHESASKPDQYAFVYRVNCTQNLIGKYYGFNLWREKKMEPVADVEMHPIATAEDLQALKFICSTGIDSRYDRLTKESVGKGFLFLGDAGVLPADLVWKALWTDGKRPKGKAKPDMALLSRHHVEWQADLKRIGQLMGGFSAVTGAVQDVTLNQTRERNRALEPWVGQSEAAFVGSWGAPQRYQDGAVGARTLHYHLSNAVGAGRFANGQSVSMGSTSCDVSVDVVGGVVRSYSTRGNGCAQILR